MRSDPNYAEGLVEEALPDSRYRITLDDGKSILAYLAGKMKINRVRVDVGDRVAIKLDPYGGKATNRITRRF